MVVFIIINMYQGAVPSTVPLESVSKINIFKAHKLNKKIKNLNNKRSFYL